LTEGVVYRFLAKGIQQTELELKEIKAMSVLDLGTIEESIRAADGDLQKAGKRINVCCNSGLLKCIKADMLRRSVC